MTRVCNARWVNVRYRWSLQAERVKRSPAFGWYEGIGGNHGIWLRAWRVERERVFLHPDADPCRRKGRYRPPCAILGGHEQDAGKGEFVNPGDRGVGAMLGCNVLAFGHPGGGAIEASVK